MIDLHCHILPGIDDGSRDLVESLAMARVAVTAGVKTIYCTPHQFDGRYENRRAGILEAVAQFKSEVIKAGIPIEILPGGEVHLHPELLDHVDRREAMTYGDAGKAILLELPHHMIPPGTAEMIFGLQTRKLTVVLAHPERNRDFLRKPERLKEFTDRGVVPQVTSDSLAGDFGPDVKKLADKIVAEHPNAIVASDAHRAEGRRIPNLKRGPTAAAWL